MRCERSTEPGGKHCEYAAHIGPATDSSPPSFAWCGVAHAQRAAIAVAVKQINNNT